MCSEKLKEPELEKDLLQEIWCFTILIIEGVLRKTGAIQAVDFHEF